MQCTSMSSSSIVSRLSSTYALFSSGSFIFCTSCEQRFASCQKSECVIAQCSKCTPKFVFTAVAIKSVISPIFAFRSFAEPQASSPLRNSSISRPHPCRARPLIFGKNFLFASSASHALWKRRSIHDHRFRGTAASLFHTCAIPAQPRCHLCRHKRKKKSK